jgi:hypothetical protein
LLAERTNILIQHKNEFIEIENTLLKE